MKWILSLSFLALISTAQAQVSPEHVSSMLDQMVRENVISAEEAVKAKIRMKNMNHDEWSALHKQATQVAATRGPASVNTIEETKGGDLDRQQFKQIEDDIRKIMPSYAR